MSDDTVTYKNKQWDVVSTETRPSRLDQVWLCLRPLPAQEPIQHTKSTGQQPPANTPKDINEAQDDTVKGMERWKLVQEVLTWCKRREFNHHSLGEEGQPTLARELTGLLEKAEAYDLLIEQQVEEHIRKQSEPAGRIEIKSDDGKVQEWVYRGTTTVKVSEPPVMTNIPGNSGDSGADNRQQSARPAQGPRPEGVGLSWEQELTNEHFATEYRFRESAIHILSAVGRVLDRREKSRAGGGG